MSNEERTALNTQIASDPRVQRIVDQRRRGSIPVYLTAAALRELGYAVPDGWKWASGGGRIQRGLFRDRSALGSAVAAAAVAVLGLGASLLAVFRSQRKS